MTRNKAYKTELDPTCKQVKQLLQHAGCARWAFNWGLQKKIDAYKVTGTSSRRRLFPSHPRSTIDRRLRSDPYDVERT